jgi:hypothetical protein
VSNLAPTADEQAALDALEADAAEFQSRHFDANEPGERGGCDWPDPEPLPSGLAAVPAFAINMLPEPFRDWIEDISDRMQCPADMVAATAMTAAGAVIGRKVGVRPEANTDWTEYPNLWGCVIGRPGVMKSPAMSEALKPLQRLQVEARTKFDAMMEDWNAGAMQRELRADARKAAMKKRLATDHRANIDDLNASNDQTPVLRRFVANDATYQSLGNLLIENPNGLLIHRDELMSLIRSLDREENCEARGFYLSGWNGTDCYTFDRIGRGTNLHVPNLMLSLIGSTQPGKISEYVAQAVAGGISDDGLLQRFQMMVWPDMKGDWRETDRPPHRASRDLAYEAFRRLDIETPAQWSAQIEPFEADRPFMRFDPDGLDVFRDWRGGLERRVRSGDLHPAMESHLAKYRKLVPALALIDHLSAGGVGSIGMESVGRSLRWASYLEGHAKRVYGAALNASSDGARRIVREASKGSLEASFTPREVQRHGWTGLADKGAVNAALEVLAEHGMARSTSTSPGPAGGRASMRWSINPKCLGRVSSVLSVRH